MTVQPLSLPIDRSAWHSWLEQRAEDQLASFRSAVAALKAAPAGERVILAHWNDAALGLANTAAVSSLMAQVHPETDVVDLAEKVYADSVRVQTELLLDAEVFAQLSSIESLVADDAGAARVLALALRDFRRAGVDRDEATRARVRELDAELVELSQRFDRGIRDGARETKVPAAALEGLPEDFVTAHPEAEDETVSLSTAYPDTLPFLTFSGDQGARTTVAHTFFNLGWPDNDEVLASLFELRHEKATMLGYADWPSYDAEVKMIGSGPAIARFIDDISGDIEKAGLAERERLLDRALRDGVEQIDLSNVRYYLEALKREEYGVDAQQVRRYFDFEKVRVGLLGVTSRLFGVTYEQVTDEPSWHESVTSYDVLLDGERLGRIHLDLHPREHKFNHAAQFDLVPGIRGRQLPEGVLVCNFSTGLVEHADVATLFHEFGHLLHHVLAGRHEWTRFSGVATEWDFVEAPSQMLEEWAWDATVLQTFATDAAGTPIPADLVEAMRAGADFGKAFLARTQMFYSAVSYRFHLERPADRTARLLELYAEYSLVSPLPDTHFHTGFGHLDDYSSCYYTYMWSKVIAKDLFSGFDVADLFDAGVARRYRDRVLTPGGSADAADLVRDFLGRPYDNEAFRAWMQS